MRDAGGRAVLSVYIEGIKQAASAKKDLRAEETHDFVLDYQDGPLVVGRGLFLSSGLVAATLIE